MADETQAQTPSDLSRDKRLEQVLAEYLRQVEQDAPVDQQALLAAHPDLADDLREFFGNQMRMQRLVGTGSPSPGRNGMPTRLRYFGDYEILEVIAQGGMGVVYKARQTSLNRIVAVKMILAGQLANESDVKRFQAEAEAAANLHHPGVVGIYEVGVQDGQHYYSMEYIDGQNLAQMVREKPLSVTQAAEYLREMAEVLEFAHQKKVLHRDLKPSNILIDASGRVRITDFGLAKRVEGESDLTITGQVLGTPSYMSPEQAAAQHAIIGPATDIYALGAILYELVTGRPPFRSENIGEILRQVQHDEPVRPRLLNPKLPRDLETICLKCLEKAPPRRYGSAQLLAEDLGNYLRGEPILARPVGAFERTWRWCQRNQLVASLMTTAAASLIVGTTVSTYFAIESGHRADEAEDNFKLARLHLNVAHMNLAQVAWEDVRVGETIRLLDLYRPTLGHDGGPDDLRSFEWHYWNRLCHSALLDLKGHTGPVMCVAFSADGKRLVSASKDQTVKVWDATTGQEMLTLNGHVGHVTSVAFSPDGKRVASGGMDGTVKVWDAMSGKELLTLKAKLTIPQFEGQNGAVTGVAFSLDGKRLASASWDQTVTVWDAKSGHETLTTKGRDGGTCLAFSPDGKRLASAWIGVNVWDAASGEQSLTMKEHINVKSLSFSPDGKRLASASREGIRVWDTMIGQETLTLKGSTGAVTSVSFSGDGKRLASTSEDQTVKIWDAMSGELTATLKGHTSSVNSVASSPEGRRFASASDDGTVKVWDVTGGQDMLTLNGHTGGVFAVAFSLDGKLLASAGSFPDATVKVWDVASGRETLTLMGHTRVVTSVAFSPDGKRLASASWDGVKIWDAITGQQMFTLKGHQDYVSSVAFSPDGRRLASASADSTVKVWEVSSGQEVFTFAGHASVVWSVAFSPDGKRLASASDDKTVRVWDATTGQETLALRGHTGRVTCVAFSADGKRLASASGDNTVIVWDATSGQETLTLKGHTDRVRCVAFSPDGKRLASASDERTVKVWDTTNGQETLTLKGHTNQVSSVAFSPGGRLLASASGDRTVKVWDARPWTPELNIEQQALGLIRFLRAKPLAKSGLLDAITADATISEPVRQRALELAHDWQE